MNLDELRAVQNKERQKDSLQHLRASFYEEVADYVTDLEAERDERAAAVEDPFASRAVRQLTDEIETAKGVAEAIYERRLGKLVKRASLAAADLPTDEEGLTAEERELFADIVDRIEQNKERVLSVVDGEGESAVDIDAVVADRAAVADEEATEVTVPPEEAGAGAAAAMGGDGPGMASDNDEGDAASGGADAAGAGSAAAAGEPADGPAVDAVDERTTVRITRDVGEIFGVDDRAYDLATDDVVTLPAENAAPLVERGAAEEVE